MSVLTAIADFFAFVSRASALERRIELGLMSPDEQSAAVRALLVEFGREVAPSKAAPLGAVAA